MAAIETSFGPLRLLKKKLKGMYQLVSNYWQAEYFLSPPFREERLTFWSRDAITKIIWKVFLFSFRCECSCVGNSAGMRKVLCVQVKSRLLLMRVRGVCVDETIEQYCQCRE